MKTDLVIVGLIWLSVLVVILAVRLNDLRKWKREIEGKTDHGDWLLVSKQEWDDFRKYFYAFEYTTSARIRELENTITRWGKIGWPNKYTRPWGS